MGSNSPVETRISRGDPAQCFNLLLRSVCGNPRVTKRFTEFKEAHWSLVRVSHGIH